MSMNRREFLKRSLTTVAAAGTAGPLLSLTGCSSDSFSSDNERPNILFITADNLGIGDLSSFGNKTVETPNIDSIGKEGAKFTSTFCVSSSCAPSRATFVSGQYPHTHGTTALTHLKPFKAISPFTKVLADYFRDLDYNTAIEGKWHVSPYLPTSWYGYNERLSGIFADDHVITGTKKTREFLERNKDNRFFLQLNYKNSHRNRYGEYDYDPEFKIDPKDVTIPEYMNLPDWPEIREDIARYFSQNMRMEQMVGEVLAMLDEFNLADNTMVLFVSDNGPHYPGMISTLYDRGVATPMMVRWPGKIKPGTVIDDMVNTIDIMPTFLDAAGIEVPDHVEGKSFLPRLTGESEGPHREEVFLEMDTHVHYIPCRAVRTRKWKYIHNYSDNAFGLDMNAHDEWAHRLCDEEGQPWKSPRQEEELYDLEADPQENNNLAGKTEYADVKKMLREKLEKHQKETNDPFLGKPFTNDFDAEVYKPVPEGHKYF